MFKWLKDLFGYGDETSFRSPVADNDTKTKTVDEQLNRAANLAVEQAALKAQEEKAAEEERLALLAKVKTAAAKPRVSKPAAMKPKPYAKPKPKPKPKAEVTSTRKREEEQYVNPVVTSPTDFGSISSSGYSTKVDSSDYSGGGGSFGGGGSSGSWDSGSSSSSSDSGSSGGGGD